MSTQSMQTRLNGVDLEGLRNTIEAVQGDAQLAKFEFRAKNRWVSGGRNESEINGYRGCSQEMERVAPFVYEADEPPVLLGDDRSANPVEFVLHALAACLTTSMVYHAAARGIQIEEVESTLEGDLDLQGFLGLSEDVRKGYENIRVSFRVKSDAPVEALQECAMMSPVFETLTRPVPVDVDIQKA